MWKCCVRRGLVVTIYGWSWLPPGPSTSRQSPRSSPTAPILGLLIFIFTVSQFLLFLTAWAATAREYQVQRPPPVPSPAVIRPEVVIRSGPAPGTVACLLGHRK
jgi:membrane protein